MDQASANHADALKKEKVASDSAAWRPKTGMLRIEAPTVELLTSLKEWARSR